jgi:hypothetical protein
MRERAPYSLHVRFTRFALGQVDASTLESRAAPGRWLCGEVLDVEGRLGGFNFQWSWSSGTVAGRAAASK